jgi:hypothetical protein
VIGEEAGDRIRTPFQKHVRLLSRVWVKSDTAYVRLFVSPFRLAVASAFAPRLEVDAAAIFVRPERFSIFLTPRMIASAWGGRMLKGLTTWLAITFRSIGRYFRFGLGLDRFRTQPKWEM